MEYRDNLNNGKNNLNGEESLNNPQLGFYNYNRFIMLSRIMNNTFKCDSNRNLLREMTVKIGLERIDIQEKITVETLTGLVLSFKFVRK